MVVFLAGVEELGRPRPIGRRVLGVAGNGNGKLFGWGGLKSGPFKGVKL